MLKRGRTDGHLSKEDYESQAPSSAEDAGDFARATPNTLASRRKVVAQRPINRSEEFARHLHYLNRNFTEWFKDQYKSDPYADLTDGFQDYIDHLVTLEDRYLRKYGEVLTFGSGDCGQLAHGTEKDEDLMVKYPRIVYSLRDKKVCGIACGGIHNAVYTDSGQVFTWGCADDGSLGRPGDESVPLLVEDLSTAGVIVIGVSCGDGQTMAVSSDGEVWGWGCYKDKEGKKWFNSNLTGAAALKDIKKQQNTPIKIPNLSNIAEVACGASFNIALSNNGVVYSWGLGESGELSRYSPPMRVKGSDGELTYDFENIQKHHLTPGFMYFEGDISSSTNSKNTDVSRTVVKQVKAIGCGAYHSLIAVVGDLLFSCGLNNYGQLGLGRVRKGGKEVEGTETRSYLVEVSDLGGKRIIMCKGGMHHSLALSSSGQVFSFGRGDSGQLGAKGSATASAGGFSPTPILVSIPPEPTTTATLSPSSKVVTIACGGNHNLSLTANNEVYTWGYGDMLALGHGAERDELLPRKINLSKAGVRSISITQVAGGGQHSALVGSVTD